MLILVTMMSSTNRYARRCCFLAFGVSLFVTLVGCGNSSYCQSGPKYGTQCYSPNDVDMQRSQQGDDKR